MGLSSMILCLKPPRFARASTHVLLVLVMAKGKAAITVNGFVLSDIEVKATTLCKQPTGLPPTSWLFNYTQMSF